ncbi:hypothetical protein [Lacticaseibacillus mingshuiensis]|uniref:ABC transporter permease n=1 Tax=Lacticaseibacillus mingshuiensis TaxID=2799574 RepID=A0ABW4CLN3_9LACO|nr:hypothetical protein [Lacticaseibacillus mingshuiensis]
MTFRAYFSLQWQRLWHAPKTIALTVIALVASLFFAIHVAPQFVPTQAVDSAAIQTSKQKHMLYIDHYKENVTTKPMYAALMSGPAKTYEAFVKQENASLQAIKAGDFAKYAGAQQKWLALLDQEIWVIGDDRSYSYPPVYYADGVDFPKIPGHYWNNETQARFKVLATRKHVSKAEVETRTATQTLQRGLTSGLALLLLAFLVLLGNDVISRDHRHHTVLAAIPLTAGQALMAKALVLLASYLLIVLSCGPICFGIIAARDGTGWQTPLAIFTGTHTVSMRTSNIFTTMPGWQFTLEALVLLVVAAWLFIRLIELLGAFSRSEYVALAGGLGLLVIEQAYWQQDIGAIHHWLAWLPTGFFDFGAILSGYQNFRYGTENFTFGTALLMLVACWLVVEVLLFALTHRKNYQLVR